MTTCPHCKIEFDVDNGADKLKKKIRKLAVEFLRCGDAIRTTELARMVGSRLPPGTVLAPPLLGRTLREDPRARFESHVKANAGVGVSGTYWALARKGK